MLSFDSSSFPAKVAAKVFRDYRLKLMPLHDLECPEAKA